MFILFSKEAKLNKTTHNIYCWILCFMSKWMEAIFGYRKERINKEQINKARNKVGDKVENKRRYKRAWLIIQIGSFWRMYFIF